ncbi:MAG: porin [Bacteroidota bacterium]
MKNMYKLLILLVAASISGTSLAQEIVKGRVTDSETGAPIKGVDVRFIGSKTEVNTDEDGYFSIEKIGTTNTLVFSHPDYDEHRFNTRDITGDLEIMMTTNVRYNQYGQKVSRQVLSAESREGFIVFESEDRNYKLWLDNRVYLDGATYFDNYDDSKTPEENLAEGRLDVPSQLLKARRMRIAFKARVGDNWYGEVDLDFDGMLVDIKDLYVRRFFGAPGSPWGQLRIGQFRMPQGMQQTTTSRYLKLMERASIKEFNPNRRLGIGWANWSPKYMFGLGLHTEETRNVLDYEIGDDNYYKGELQGAKPMLGVSTRGAYFPINETGKLVSIGLGYSRRTPGLYKHPDSRIKYDPKDETYVSEMEFTVAKVGGVKTATNMNVDAAVSYGPWRMTGEYHINTLAMKSSATPVNFSGFYVQSAFLLTGETHAWNHREGEFTQVRANRESGAWEVAARYSYINLNDFDAGVRGGQKGQYTVGLNYYASRNVKFMLNYSYVDHDQYSNGAGDYSDWVIESAPGEPANPGFDYGFLAWRVEIDF